MSIHGLRVPRPGWIRCFACEISWRLDNGGAAVGIVPYVVIFWGTSAGGGR